MHRAARHLSLLLVLVGAGCRPSPPPAAPVLTGAWRAQLQFTTGAFASVKDLEFMYVFNAGGTMTESSNYDGAPPVPPAYGIWREVGNGGFEAKYEFYITAPSPPDAFKAGAGWLPSGRGVFTERIKVAADGDHFESTITYEAFNPQGQPIEGGGTATSRGTRIRW